MLSVWVEDIDTGPTATLRPVRERTGASGWLTESFYYKGFAPQPQERTARVVVTGSVSKLRELRENVYSLARETVVNSSRTSTGVIIGNLANLSTPSSIRLSFIVSMSRM